MNWLGWSTRAFVCALAGALLGAVLYDQPLARSFDAPWLVGLGMGIGAFAGAPDRSGMRGLLVATMSIWGAWAVQARVPPYDRAGLFGFHETLNVRRCLAFVACGAVAFFFARASIRSDARRRAAGS